MTVIIAGTQDVQGVQFWYVSTRMLTAVILPTILAMAIQRYIVRGLTLRGCQGVIRRACRHRYL